MDYTKLYYFYIVAKHAHVTRAAEEIHIAQPALTKAIRALEESLGVKLLCRQGRNVALTQEGAYLKDRLEQIVPRIENLDQDLKDYASRAGKSVRINVLAASTLVTETVVSFRKQYNDIEFHLIRNETDTDAHITIATLPISMLEEKTKQGVTVYREPIYLAVPRESVYAKRNSIDLHEVADEAFVSLAGSRGFRSVCDSICRDIGLRPKTMFESDSILSVRNFIGASLGVGFWPAFTWGSEANPEIARIPIRKPRCFRLLTLQLHEDRDPNSAERKFYQYLSDVLSQRTEEAQQNLLFKDDEDLD